MLRFDHAPPPDANGQSLPITRTPARGLITAACTSPQLYGCHTHYWGGRTLPCTHPDCDACTAGAPFRWHAYLGAWNEFKQIHFLFECTAAAAEQFTIYEREHGTLRGCAFRAYRASQRSNSRCIIECNVWQGKPADLPPAPDLAAVLCRLWNIPLSEISTPEIEKSIAEVRDLDIKIQKLRTATPNNGRD